MGINIDDFSINLLQRLIGFNTTNPPGNEGECILFLEGIFKSEGFKTQIIGKNDERLNLYVQYEGKGEAPPLLMYGHVDVVTTEGEKWKHDPFAGKISDGCIWGRGTLDMKGAVAMMCSALIKMKREGKKPSGDIILMIVCDEENGGIHGAKYVCDEYTELFKDVKYAIGEIGGFTMYFGERKVYPIMIGEKQKCDVKMTFKGEGGHGSMPVRGGAMGQLGYVLNAVDKKYMPCHIIPEVKLMLSELSAVLPSPYKIIFKSLMNPIACNKTLKLLKGKGRFFEPLIHNTITPTIVKGGKKINVIPQEITLEFDGRILPGYGPDNLKKEIKTLLGKEVNMEITNFVKGPNKLNMGLYKFLGDILKEKDNDGTPIPYFASGVTDARHFSKLGIQTYGFTPMYFEKGVDYSKLIHSANERIPIKVLKFGTDAIYKLLTGYNSSRILKS